MKKHGNCKKYHGHKKIVGGIVAAALAFTVVVGSQLGAVNPAQIATDMYTDPYAGTGGTGGTGYTQPTYTTCPDGSQVPMGTTCPTTQPTNTTCPDGSTVPMGTTCPTNNTTGTYSGTTGTSGTIWCISLSRQATTAECNAADAVTTGQTGTYSGTTGTYSGTAGTYSGTAGTYSGGNCTAGQYWDYGTSTCKSNPTGTYSGTAGTYYSGSTSGQYKTQATCETAALFWGTKSNWCFNTQAEKTAGETAAGYSMTSGQTWSGPTGSGMYSGTTGTYYSGSTSGQYKTQATCEAAALFWGTKSNWCFNTQAEKTAGETAAGYSMTSGQTWSGPMGSGPTGSGMYSGPMGSGSMGSGQYMAPQVPFCEPPSYYDWMKQACQTPMNAMTSTDFTKSFTQNFQDKGCAPWDTYCQKMMDKGQFDEGQDEGNMFGQEWENADCLNEKDAKRQKVEIKRDIQNLEQQLSVVDFSNASDLPAAVQAKSALDSIKSMNFEDSCEIGKAREILNTFQGDGGIQDAVNSANEIGNFRRELERIVSEIAQERKFRTSEKAKGYLDKAEDAVEALRDNPPYNPEEPWKLWESLDPKCRRGGFGGGFGGNMGGFGGGFGGDMGGGKGGGGFEFDSSSLGISSFSFGGNPFGGDDEEGGFGGMGGFGGNMGGFGGNMGGFGGNMGGFQDPCSLEDLLKGGTPRGYLDAARRSDDDSRQEDFKGNICKDAGEKINQFKNVVGSSTGTSKTEGLSIVKEASGILSKCDKVEDKMQVAKMLDKIRVKAENWMEEADVDMSEFEAEEGYDRSKLFQFGGMDQLMGEDLFAKIQAYINEQVDKRISEELPKLTQVFEERLSSIVARLDQSIMDRITSIASSGSFEQGVIDQLGGVVELASFVPEGAADNVNTQQDLTTQMLQVSENISQISEDAEEAVADLQEVLTERTYPIVVLETVQDAVDQAETMANNGSDPSDVLEDAVQLIEGYSDADLNALQAAEGTWQFVDVVPSATEDRPWYVANVAEAYERGVATGTAVTVEVAGTEIEARNFEPSKTLNVAEGLTMITKSAGLEPVSEGDVAPEIERLAGDSDWAAPYLQALANEIGVDEVRGSFESAGGAPSDPMARDNFAHVAVALYEDMGGNVSADPESEIGHYEDFGQMTDMERYDFAAAHEMGMITGANGGTTANFDATANRAEAAKMLSVFNEFAEQFEVFGESAFIGTPDGNLTGEEEFVPEI